MYVCLFPAVLRDSTYVVMAESVVEGWSQYLSVNLTCIFAVLAAVIVFVWYQ